MVEKVRFCINEQDMLVQNPHKSDHILFEIPHRIGMEKLKQLADENKMTLGELLAILSVEDENAHEEASHSKE